MFEEMAQPPIERGRGSSDPLHRTHLSFEHVSDSGFRDSNGSFIRLRGVLSFCARVSASVNAARLGPEVVLFLAPPGFQNATTSSEERTSAEAEGYRIERALMDCVAPLRRRGATQSISVLEQNLGC